MDERMLEHPLPCPYCGETITMLLDLTTGDQEYVEDCEVCCNPIAVRLRARDGRVLLFETHAAG